MTNCDRPEWPVENSALERASKETEGLGAERGGASPPSETRSEAVETRVEVSEREARVALDPALLAELREVTDEPARAIDTAVRQWLQRRAIKESDTSRPLPVNPLVPPRGEWND